VQTQYGPAEEESRRIRKTASGAKRNLRFSACSVRSGGLFRSGRGLNEPLGFGARFAQITFPEEGKVVLEPALE
jgi:hypothetical protein